jgi:hypothetical protein
MNALHLIALGPLLAIQALAQITAPAPAPVTQRDPQALSLLSQSLAAMTKGTPIQDIKLQAQATRTAGSETDTGSAVLEAAAYDKSNTNLALTSGPRLEIRNGTAGVWSAASAQNQPIAMHNTWTAAAWFAPVLVIQSWIQDSSFSLGYAGLDARAGRQLRGKSGRPALQLPAKLLRSDPEVTRERLRQAFVLASGEPDPCKAVGNLLAYRRARGRWRRRRESLLQLSNPPDDRPHGRRPSP